MKGFLLPHFVFVRSEIVPKSGSIKSASRLSSDIMMPDRNCDIPNLSLSIFGIIVS